MREMVLEGLSDNGAKIEGIAVAADARLLLRADQVPGVIVADVNSGRGLNRGDLAAIARECHSEVALVLISGGAPAAGAGGASARRSQHALGKHFSREAQSRTIRAAAADAAAAAIR